MTDRQLSMRPTAGHGLTKNEQLIMDLHDGGATLHEILRTVKLTRPYVQGIISEYHFGKLGLEMTRAEQRARSQDIAYQRALAASGGTFA